LMHMKVDSMSFLELLLFWNLNVAGANATLFHFCLSFLSNKIEHMFPLSK
jgi:hypothetical protein